MVYFSPRSRLVSKKKKQPFWNCCKGSESFGGYAGQFEGEEFCFGRRRPLLPPPPNSGPDTFAKQLFKTMNDKQITVFIAIKRRPYFSIIIY